MKLSHSLYEILSEVFTRTIYKNRNNVWGNQEEVIFSAETNLKSQLKVMAPLFSNAVIKIALDAGAKKLWELDLTTFMGPFQLQIFYDSKTINYERIIFQIRPLFPHFTNLQKKKGFGLSRILHAVSF